MKKQRMTKQRMLILEELKARNDHPTAQQLYETVKRKMPSISFGTVYRNLSLLHDLGLINEFNYQVAHFDGNTSKHYHFVCTSCRKIYDIHENFNNIEKKVASRFTVKGHRIEFFGLCNVCISKEGD